MIQRAILLVLSGFLAVSGADAIQEFRLPNGLRAILAENHERPLVRLELRTAWDPSEDPADKAGLGGFLAEMLTASGAGPLKRDAFQQFLEDRALRLTFAMQSRAYSWSILSDSQGQDGAFESLAMAATRPDLDATVMEVRKQSYFKTLKERSPRMRAEARFQRRIGDPSGSLLPDEGSLARIGFQDLLLMARRVLRPERSVLVIQGDVNLSQAKQLTMLHLGAWGPGSQEPVPTAPAEQAPPIRTWMIRGAETPVRIKFGAAFVAEKPVPLSTMAICSWLVRRELAFSLPPPMMKAELRTFPAAGWMIETVSGKSVPEAMEAVQKLLLRLREKRFDAAEMNAARAAWNVERTNQVLHPQQEAASLADQALSSGGLYERVDNLRAEDVQAVFGQLFSAEACSYFVVGAVSQDAAWLAKAGLDPVETVN